MRHQLEFCWLWLDSRIRSKIAKNVEGRRVVPPGTPYKRYSIQKTLQGRATNMGSKISLLVYEWPLIKCKIWNMNMNFPKFEQKLAHILDFFFKTGHFAQNWANWCMNGLLYLEKLVFVWVYFQIPWRHIPTKTNLVYHWLPHPSNICNIVTYRYSSFVRFANASAGILRMWLDLRVRSKMADSPRNGCPSRDDILFTPKWL